MKINEVEARSGITKKNIRFYEAQGLVSPSRNSENGYREYCEEDVAVLRRIKLLRKLGVPIEEIRIMLAGTHTVGDGMRRHLVTLERERKNLEQSAQLCRELQSADIPLAEIDAEEILTRMEEMERNGTSFQNKQNQDTYTRYMAPVVITAIMVALMVVLSVLIFWAYRVKPADAPPLWFLWVLVIMLAAVALGCVLAMVQRIREIRKGEMEDAKNY